jgi:hypothetical protein
MQERRKIQRRHNGRDCDFPLQTRDGKIIDTDRRHLPDRRMDNITVEEITCEDFISELSRSS